MNRELINNKTYCSCGKIPGSAGVIGVIGVIGPLFKLDIGLAILSLFESTMGVIGDIKLC